MRGKEKYTAFLLLILCKYILPLVSFFFFFWFITIILTFDRYKEIKSNFSLNFPTSKN